MGGLALYRGKKPKRAKKGGRNHMYKKILASQYDIPEIIEIESLSNGRTCEARIVKTKKQKYVLRSVREKERFDLEYSISMLKPLQAFVPRILTTQSKVPYIKIEHTYFNLQEYIENVPLVMTPETCAQLGKKVAIMHNELNVLKDMCVTKDRFNIDKEYKKLKYGSEKMYQTLYEVYKNPDDIYQALRLYDQDRTQMIHGDLGFWNLLNHHGQIYIIDFGEVRMGSHYSDIAALINSFSGKYNFHKDGESLLRPFFDAYLNEHHPLDWGKLIQYIKLWNFKGMVSYLNSGGTNPNLLKEIAKTEEGLLRMIDRFSNDYSATGA